MRYLALRRRADLLLAGLGADRSRTLVIEGGGIPEDARAPPDAQAPPSRSLSPADSEPADQPRSKSLGTAE
jgi:hypothetical protein